MTAVPNIAKPKKRYYLKSVLWVALVMLFSSKLTASNIDPWLHSCPVPKPDASAPILAIIIDDLGYQLEPAKQLLKLDTELTLAIIPFTPFGTKLAELANQSNHEIMVHAPMETLSERPWEKALNVRMDQSALVELGQQMLEAVPHAKGLNNHGGSLLTAHAAPMDWLMALLASRDLYFIDSRTTADTVASHRAWSAGIAHASRDVFLDNQRDTQAISAQLQKAIALAQQRGHAIAIGHPYPETLAVLQDTLPQLKLNDVKLVRISTLLNRLQSQPVLAQNTAQSNLTTTHPNPN